MTRVLVLAYYFPPIGGAGAQRPAKFVRFLPSRGYEPTVITGPGDSIGRWTPPDVTLSNEVGDAATIVRLLGPEPMGRASWTTRVKRWIGFPSAWARWWTDGAVHAGREVPGVDLIYAWMSPYESAEAAARLGRELGKPWVADLGDPWALDEMMVFPSAAHRRRELRRMRRLLNTAVAIVVSTPEAATRIREAFPELRTKPIVPIPNGFDASDFEMEPPIREDGAFRIVHTGYLHTELGRQQRRTASIHRILGGETQGVDILTRSHIYLLQAIEGLLERRPDLRSRVEVHLAGILSNADKEVADRSDTVRLHGYLPHAESIALLRSADLLFLPMQNLPSGRRSSTVPGKTYEYLASGRPILGAVPAGDARDILEESGQANVCAPDDVDAMTRIIIAQVDRDYDASGTISPSSDGLSRFEYRTLSGLVADVFDGVLALQRLTEPFRVSRSLRIGHFAERVNMSKTVLHIAYFFPPIGGAGAQRSLKFVRYLPAFGYASKVITGSGESGGRWTPADTTLADEIGLGTEVHRVPGAEPPAALGWTGRAERYLSLRSAWSRWWTEGTFNLGKELGSVDVILASMSPYESAEVAAQLAVRLQKPWVAGLRDPWALDEMMVFPSALHRRRELRRMRRLLGSAAAVIVTSQETVVQLRAAFPELRTKPIVSIPNGFDASDFEAEIPARDDGVFRIVHTGYLHTELGRQQRRTARLHRLLGGESQGVDILTRSHIYLLQAVEELLKRRPELRSRIEIHLAGVLSEADRDVAARSGVVRLHGYVPHTESIGLLRSADLLFLPMQNLPPGRRSSTVPGKTYEYIASGRPILAAVPDGDARDILEAVGTSRFCRPGDSAGIADAISGEVDRWFSGQAPPEPAPEVLARFERRHLTSELAAVLEAVTRLDRSVLAEAPCAPQSGRDESRALYAT
jgi:glycosyltransferase involved in cell wall biosynthesis